MRCPYCSTPDCRVIDSRAVDGGRTIKRRRGCSSCGNRFTTFETVEQMPLMVLKHDGSRQIFDINKLLNGLIRSCDKRDKSLDSLMALAHNIEQNLRQRYEKEFKSKYNGESTLDQLKYFDHVYYNRFPRVYRRFTDIQSFKKELDVLAGHE